ncbi:MAG TPA: SDR family NAD(P)-dependent oxidoreductase [Candidatus Binataceae bacterium]|nr:SDR family NAD(P)-dependent oxidoreductase [Candidatus Binataceae bacterium]
MAESKPVAVVTGVGPGLGAALVRRFAKQYNVAMVARSGDYLRSLANDVKASGELALAVPADVGDSVQLKAAFRQIRDRLGDPEVLLYNAGSGTWGSVLEISPEQFETSWRVNSYGAFIAAKEVASPMIAGGHGVMLFTGATAGVKAGPKSVAFGPAKFAMRGLAQALARDLGPKGIHVAWINVDGIIDLPRLRERLPNVKDEDLLKPDAIAETYWHLAHQDRSAWTMELEVRPFKEKF